MCGGICGPAGDSDEGHFWTKSCNVCGKTLRMCSCMDLRKISTKKKKKRSVIEELAEG